MDTHCNSSFEMSRTAHNSDVRKCKKPSRGDLALGDYELSAFYGEEEQRKLRCNGIIPNRYLYVSLMGRPKTLAIPISEKNYIQHQLGDCATAWYGLEGHNQA